MSVFGVYGSSGSPYMYNPPSITFPGLPGDNRSLAYATLNFAGTGIDPFGPAAASVFTGDTIGFVPGSVPPIIDYRGAFNYAGYTSPTWARFGDYEPYSFVPYQSGAGYDARFDMSMFDRLFGQGFA